VAWAGHAAGVWLCGAGGEHEFQQAGEIVQVLAGVE